MERSLTAQERAEKIIAPWEQEFGHALGTDTLKKLIAAQISEAEREALTKNRCNSCFLMGFYEGFNTAKEQAAKIAVSRSQYCVYPGCHDYISGKISEMEPLQ